MSASHEDENFDFDLEYLQSPSVVTISPEKTQRCKKSIRIVKKKIVATDSLIRKFMDKTEEAQQHERALQTSKDECKNICCDLKNMTDKYNTIQKEVQSLRINNAELKERFAMSESHNGAIQSHANQLQVLVKENESVIASLKVENQLLKVNVKDCEKSILSLQNQNADLKKDISLMKDYVSGKKKLNKRGKLLLKKYANISVSDHDDSILEDNSDTDTENHCLFSSINEVHISPLQSPVNNDYEGTTVTSKNDNDRDSDTGRGSSLAFSDGEKCFNSPDYYMNHSPINAHVEKEKRICVDTATSPINFEEDPKKCPSPIITCEKIQIVLSPIDEENTEADVQIEPEPQACNADNTKRNIGTSVSPCPDNHDEGEHTCKPNVKEKTSKEKQRENVQATLNQSNSSETVGFDDLPTRRFKRISNSEVECLDFNNSNNLDENNSDDCEVKMILDKMRFNPPLITPIPSTPLKSRRALAIRSRSSRNSEMNVEERLSVIEKQIKSLTVNLIDVKTHVMNNKSKPRNYENRKTRKDIFDIFNETDAEDGVASVDDDSVDIVIQLPQSPSPENFSLSEIVESDLLHVGYRDNDMFVNDNAENQVLSNVSGEDHDDKLLAKFKHNVERENVIQSVNNGEQELANKHYNKRNYGVNYVVNKPNYNINVECDNVTKKSNNELDSVAKNKNNIKRDHATNKHDNKQDCTTKNKNNDEGQSLAIKKHHDERDRISNKHGNIQDSVPIILNSQYVAVNKRNIDDEASKQYSKRDCISTSAIKGGQCKKICENNVERELNTYRHKNMPSRIAHVTHDKNHYVAVNTHNIERDHTTSKHDVGSDHNVDKHINDIDHVAKTKQKLDIHCVANNNYNSKHDQVTNDKHNHEQHSFENNNDTECTGNNNHNDRDEIERKNIENDCVTNNSYNEERDRAELKHTYERGNIANNSHKKLSKLERMRKKLVPKGKIKKRTPTPINKKLIKPIQFSPSKKTSLDKDPAAILNNKSAYEKAVRIMSEINLQKSLKNKEHSPKKNIISDMIVEEPTNCNKDVTKDQNNENSPSKSYINEYCKKELVVTIVKCDDYLNCHPDSPKKQIATRSRSKCVEEKSANENQSSECDNSQVNNVETGYEFPEKCVDDETQPDSRKRLKRISIDSQVIPCKRILRSSNLSQSTENNLVCPNEIGKSTESTNIASVVPPSSDDRVLNYSDLDMFNNDSNINSTRAKVAVADEKEKRYDPAEIIFCKMLEKYVKRRKKQKKGAPQEVLTTLSKTLENEIASITQLNSSEAKNEMNKLIDNIKSWNLKQFISALLIYLRDPQRKIELFNKIYYPPAPPSTKSEQVLVYVIYQLPTCWPSEDVTNDILSNIEYDLFKLNKTHEFDTIESMSHFYAVLCRYHKMDSKLKLFMLDAMYCIQYKSVAVVKQCLEVWTHILPLAHMGMAKSPLVMCMVYLLHFYKCEDKFNRVQDIRNILSRKYFYNMSDWNEAKILDTIKNAIKEITDCVVETKMLRLAIIVLCKRQGPRWCQHNIVRNILLPTLEKNVPQRVRIFCITVLGSLLKPYPVDMKVHCVIVMNNLIDTLKQNPSLQVQEAIITSLVYMSKHNLNRVLQSMLHVWHPPYISLGMEETLRDFIHEKPFEVWMSILSKVHCISS